MLRAVGPPGDGVYLTEAEVWGAGITNRPAAGRGAAASRSLSRSFIGSDESTPQTQHTVSRLPCLAHDTVKPAALAK